MKKLLIFAVGIMFSSTIYSATGDIQHTAAVKAYKSRCQNGDYINAKFEELKDIEQINIIGNKYKKSPFVSSCNNLQIKPNEEKISPPSSAKPEIKIPIGDTYEAVDMRYRAELGIYSKKCSRGDYAIYKDELLRDVNRLNELANQLGKPKFDPNSLKNCDTNPSFFTGGGYVLSEAEKAPLRNLQNNVRLTMLEVINGCSEDHTYKIFNEIANCVKENYNSRGTSPSDNSVKAFYIFLDEIVTDTVAILKAGFSREDITNTTK